MLGVLFTAVLLAQDQGAVPESYCDHLSGTRVMALRTAVSDMALRDTDSNEPAYMRTKGRLLEAIRFDAACRSAVFGDFNSRGVRFQQHLDALKGLGLPDNHPDVVFIKTAMKKGGASNAQSAASNYTGNTAASMADTEAVRTALFSDQQLLNYHRLEREYATMLVMGFKKNHPDSIRTRKRLANLRTDIQNRPPNEGAGKLCAQADRMMLGERMIALQSQLQSLLGNGYGEKHPDVVGMRKQIKNLETTSQGKRPC